MGKSKVHVYVNKAASNAPLPGVIKKSANGEKIEVKNEIKHQPKPASAEEMKEILDNVYSGKKKTKSAKGIKKMDGGPKKGIDHFASSISKSEKTSVASGPLPGPHEDDIIHRPDIGDVVHTHKLTQFIEEPGKVVGEIKSNYVGIISNLKPMALVGQEENANGKEEEVQIGGNGQKIQEISSAPQDGQIGLAPYLNQKNPESILEAALFMSSSSVSSVELGKLVGIAVVGQVQDAMKKLADKYEKSGSAIEITEENTGKWVMRIRSHFAPHVRQFAGESEITRHALKTLAYISRNDGIKKRDLFKRLGAGIYLDVAELEEKGFLVAKPSGRTKTLHTSSKFKQYFGV